MDEKRNFTVLDENGNQVICEPLFTFDSEETKKQYVVYTDNSKDAFGNVRVFASIYKMNEKGGELLPIKTDREWKVIETILETIQEENKKDGV
jgi:uncharacterized protein YrzB (UPF0473 family)